MDDFLPIDQRTKQFAIRIVKLYQYLTDERHEKVLSKQVLRSGTSKYIHHRHSGCISKDRPSERRKMNNSALFHLSPFTFTSPMLQLPDELKNLLGAPLYAFSIPSTLSKSTNSTIHNSSFILHHSK